MNFNDSSFSSDINILLLNPTIADLHWLPVCRRLEFKVCCLVHKCLHGEAPQYLKDLLKPASSSSVSMGLRSQVAPRLHQPIVHVSAARGAFSLAAPAVWNSLPPSVRGHCNFASFKTALKTHLFPL